MPYVEKIVGEVCKSCNQGKYVRNPRTDKVFCDKKCWLNGQTSQAPAAAAQVSQFDLGTIEDLQAKIGDLTLTISTMRAWATKINGEMASLRALVELVAGEDATVLHTTIPPKAKIDTVPWTERLATEHQGDNMSPSA